MRQGQQTNNANKQRMRGRNRKGPNPLTRSYESNGGDVKIRGTALHVAEKYVQLARDAQSSGDRVAAENYLQHAEHYYRIIVAAQAQMPQPQPVFRNDEDGDEDDGQENRSGANGYGQSTPQQSGQPQAFGLSDPQPYVNGTGPADPDDDGGPDQGDSRFDTREMPMMQPPQQNYGDRGGYNNNTSNNNSNRGPNEQGGGYRGRRRRPFRDRHNEPREAGASGGDNPPAAATPEAPRSEE